MAFDQRSLDDYVDVAERIEHFRFMYPGGSLRGDWRMHEVGGQWLVAYRAEAYRTADDQAPGVGCAWELVPGRTPYTRGSELQNAETSAWGRAIIAVGASDAKRGIASRDEVAPRRAEREDGLPVNRDGSLSRSRTTDEEKAAAGVMTSAQRAEHTKLQAKRGENKPSERIAALPADDPWYDVSPPEDRGAERDYDSPRTITKGQQAQYHARMNALGVKDRDERLAITRRLTGMENISGPWSSSDLSKNAADALLAVLRAAGEGDSVAQLAVEEARRRPA